MWLSRKQMWRRVKSCGQELNGQTYFEDMDIYSFSEQSDSGKASTCPTEVSSVDECNESSFNDLFDQFQTISYSPRPTPKSLSSNFVPESMEVVTESSKNKKKVTFLQTVKVILIPTKEELKPLFEQLYYSAEECVQFRNECHLELTEYRDSSECLRKRNHLLLRGLLQPLDSHIEARNSVELLKTKCGKGTMISHMLDLLFTASLEGNYYNTDIYHHTHYDIQIALSQPCTIRDASAILYQPWKEFENVQ